MKSRKKHPAAGTAGCTPQKRRSKDRNIITRFLVESKILVMHLVMMLAALVALMSMGAMIEQTMSNSAAAVLLLTAVMTAVMMYRYAQEEGEDGYDDER